MRIALTAFLSVILAFATSAGATTREDAAQGVVMIHGSQTLGAPALPEGAGIVIGATADRLYVVTAAHVAAPGGTPLENLTVRLRNRPGEPFEAMALDLVDEVLDVAVIAVDLARYPGLWSDAGPRPSALPTALAPKAVYVVGQGERRAWSGNLQAADVVDLDPYYVSLPASVVEPGHSGGGVFDDDWRLAGMMIEIAGDKARALRTNVFVERLQEWGIPVFESLADPLAAGAPAEWLAARARVDVYYEDLGTSKNLVSGFKFTVFNVSGHSGLDVPYVPDVTFYLYAITEQDRLQLLYATPEPFFVQDMKFIQAAAKKSAPRLLSCIQHPVVSGQGYVFEIVEWGDTRAVVKNKPWYEKAKPSEARWSAESDPCGRELADRIETTSLERGAEAVPVLQGDAADPQTEQAMGERAEVAAGLVGDIPEAAVSAPAAVMTAEEALELAVPPQTEGSVVGAEVNAGRTALLSGNPQPYGPAVAGLRLGMSFAAAERIIRGRSEVARVLVADRAVQFATTARQVQAYTSGRIYVSADGREAIGIFDEPPAAPDIVVALWREVLLPDDVMTPAALFDRLQKRFGDHTEAERSSNVSPGMSWSGSAKSGCGVAYGSGHVRDLWYEDGKPADLRQMSFRLLDLPAPPGAYLYEQHSAMETRMRSCGLTLLARQQDVSGVEEKFVLAIADYAAYGQLLADSRRRIAAGGLDALTSASTPSATAAAQDAGRQPDVAPSETTDEDRTSAAVAEDVVAPPPPNAPSGESETALAEDAPLQPPAPESDTKPVRIAQRIDAVYWSTRGANVRRLPDPGSKKIGFLPTGTPVQVHGLVAGEHGGYRWYQVALPNGQPGYVATALLAADAPQERAAEPAGGSTDVSARQADPSAHAAPDHEASEPSGQTSSEPAAGPTLEDLQRVLQIFQ